MTVIPGHLWNLLYRAVAVRTEQGVAYGLDASEPFSEPFDDPGRLVKLLDEFLAHHGEALAPDPVRRALLQNDLWTAFDLVAGPASDREAAPLRERLARVIRRLALSEKAIAALPDNYAQAIHAGAFAPHFDPAHPDQPFLPPDLFDSQGPWVELRNPHGSSPLAAVHVGAFGGRSWFSVLIRCPGGRQATLAYLDSLNLHPTPWALRPAPISRRASDHLPARMDPLRPDPHTPQFPEGTAVALVRRMMVIGDNLEPVATHLVQKVQLRVYLKIIDGTLSGPPQTLTERQRTSELVMRRRELLAGSAGGFHAVTPDETEYQKLSVWMGPDRARLLRGPVVLDSCARCHSANGVFSVNSYYQVFASEHPANPQLTPVDPLPAAVQNAGMSPEGPATESWKAEQFEWGLLIGLLESQGAALPPH